MMKRTGNHPLFLLAIIYLWALKVKYMFSHFLQCVFLLSAPGGSEWILIILAVLILFGGRKIPEFMKGLGRGMREFNDAKSNVKKEFEDGLNETPKANPPTSTTTSTNNP
ncbi:MAG TPA: twin-arginine translocase TatA/TatE family subunit [Puia sp.]|nr:twin-arginine translocase TatA/TatE family subunit [Puia sp.]